MSDLIKRDDAIRMLDEYIKPFVGLIGDMGSSINGAREIIKSIPTAEPMVGKQKIEEMVNIWGKGYRLTCLECGDVLTVTENALPYERYCRCCGVKIERRE